MFHVPERYRTKDGPFASSKEDGNNGHFDIPLADKSIMQIIASDGMGWEHVSLTIVNKKRKLSRCPQWYHMCLAKELFWDKQDCVVQFHPPESKYVNNHPYVLHLWRQVDKEFPMPDLILVGVR